MKVRLPIDQNAVMPGGHLAIDRLERAQQPHRIAVAIARRDILRIGLVPGLLLLEELPQSIMRLGEARLQANECAIAIDALIQIGRLEAARCSKLSSKRVALVARSRAVEE